MRVTLEDMERLERVALDLDGRIKTLEAELTEARAALVYKRQVADEAIRAASQHEGREGRSPEARRRHVLEQ